MTSYLFTLWGLAIVCAMIFVLSEGLAFISSRTIKSTLKYLASHKESFKSSVQDEDPEAFEDAFKMAHSFELKQSKTPYKSKIFQRLAKLLGQDRFLTKALKILRSSKEERRGLVGLKRNLSFMGITLRRWQQASRIAPFVSLVLATLSPLVVLGIGLEEGSLLKNNDIKTLAMAYDSSLLLCLVNISLASSMAIWREVQKGHAKLLLRFRDFYRFEKRLSQAETSPQRTARDGRQGRGDKPRSPKNSSEMII